jgi:FAD/FMN-containing dehydrogenase
LKQGINAWGAKRADFPLMQRVKQAFDPHNIFAPGRFVGGI